MSSDDAGGVPLAERVVGSTRPHDLLRRSSRYFALPPFLYTGRARTSAILQLGLCSVILLLAAIALVGGFPGDQGLFWIACLIVLTATGAAILIPWARVSAWWVITIPLIDFVAIVVLRQSYPPAQFGALFFLPVIWLATFYGLAGYLMSVVLVPLVIVTTSLLDPRQTIGYHTTALAVMIVVVASISIALARQMTAQRLLFARQTGTMARTLRRAQKQEELLAEVLDTIDFGVIRIAADGSSTIANEAHTRLQRALRTIGPERGAPFAADGVTPLDLAEIPFARAARGEVFDNQIVWFGRAGSRRRALSVTARRTRAVDGTDSGAVVVSRDVTSELTALRARDSLVASVSHELRTPLTSIIGYLELAVDDPSVPERARKNLEVAERNAARLLEIVSDILTASSRSEMSADLTISQQDIDVGEVVRASGEAWEAAASDRAIEIDVSGIRPVHAYADPLRMRQVIDNLVSNAVKYNRDGGRVDLATHSDGLTTTIVVQDTGFGLNAHDRSRLFERFFRADETSAGTGLGLAISRDLVRAHGGDIAVTSTMGVGTTFTVSLPASADNLQDSDRQGPRTPTGAIDILWDPDPGVSS